MGCQCPRLRRTASQAASVDFHLIPCWSCLSPLFAPAPSPTQKGGCLAVGGGGVGRTILAAAHKDWASPSCVSPRPCLPRCAWNPRASAGFREAVWLPASPSLWEHNRSLYSAKRVNEPPFAFPLLKLQTLCSTAVFFLFSFSF